ncbi:MAG: dihydropteroate synthase [Gemmatimonadota bacterium]
MIGRPLAAHSPRAVREVLLRYGWDEIRADAAATSVEAVVILLESVPEATIEALVGFNRQLGIDLLTGEGWVLLAGSRSRLAAFARPWVLPPDLLDVAMAVGLALPGERIGQWQTARSALSLDQPRIAGIINLTPDSFSDGGNLASVDEALVYADHLLATGADFLDVGGESTRPGASPVAAAEELHRVIPVVEALVREYPSLIISVDTVKSEVARAALSVGAAAINDVSAFRLDRSMGRVVAEGKAGAILMHSRGGVGDMASLDHANYGADLLGTVLHELRDSLEQALSSGILPDAIVIDPGMGFSKSAEQSLAVLDGLSVFSSLNRPILVGPSRKRFLGAATGAPVDDRDRATAVACVMAYERGARLFRVHNTAFTREALRLAAVVRQET